MGAVIKDGIIHGINHVISVCCGVIDGIRRICNGEAGTIEMHGAKKADAGEADTDKKP